jgi:DNA-binding HxlR family transcriptional regulator
VSFPIEAWLHDVEADQLYADKKYAWLAAHALAPWLDADGVATVDYGTLKRGTGLNPRTLRRGFVCLEQIGRLTRDQRKRKPNKADWETTTYRARFP